MVTFPLRLPASSMIPAQPLCSPSLIGTPTPGTVVGTLKGGMWKPGVHEPLWRETSLPMIFVPVASSP